MKLKDFQNGAKTVLKQACVAGSLFLYAACGAATDADSGATAASEAFPADLAVASPTDVTEDDGTTNLTLSSVKFSGTPSAVPSYAFATARINQILNSGSAALCTFDPNLFLIKDDDAGCFGPHVLYESHPDTTSSDPNFDGNLPTGDVGIWESVDADTGHACAAAELNQRMRGVSAKSMASLSGLASMVCVINTSGYSMPSSSTLNLLTEMNALGISGVTFTDATISHQINGAGKDEYSYSLEFTFMNGAQSYDIEVDMSHVPGSAPSSEYSGKLSYLVTDSFTGGNCPTSDVTDNASLEYVRHARDSMDVQVRSALFCEHGSDGRGTDGLVDPSEKYDSVSNPDGWGNDFAILTANYDPTTLIGDYAYAWQAGPNDANSRVFNLHVDQLASSTPYAYSFYGYGEDIETTDGSITGFICNWAGPGSSHTVRETAQFQLVQFDSTAHKFLPIDENIEYAPVDACSYDGSGSFIYDTDADADLSDETHHAVTEDLYDATDIDGDGNVTIEENIDATGFVPPTI